MRCSIQNATVLLALAVFSLIAGSERQLFAARDADEALIAAALAGTIVGAGITGMFDAVLLLALPAFIVWSALGALWTPVGNPDRRARGLPVVIVIAMIAAAVIGTASRGRTSECPATETCRAPQPKHPPFGLFDALVTHPIIS